MKTFRIITIWAVMAVFLIPGATDVSAKDRKPVAEVMVGAYGLSWTPSVSYAQLVLTVQNPEGQVFKRVFNAGAVPGFDLSDLEPPIVDGSYNYELRVIPVLPNSNLNRGERLGFEQKLTAMETLTQSGHFHVKDGAIANPNMSEGPSRTADQVINDDLIVTFSACIGNDCVNGESFGFDTLRLKENNLRIHFQDTSNSASFPTNDWRIVINDSSNGGGNYFGVEDSNTGRLVFKIDAGAPTDAVRVDSAGDLGLGTSAPVVDVHVVDGNTPTLRLEQNGSSGFTPQTWDVAGNEANFFIRDATNGSKLPLKIKPNAPTSSIFVAADGNVGFGTESPDSQVHVTNSGSAATFKVDRTDTGTETIIKSTGTNGIIGTFAAHDLILNVGNAARLTLGTDGSITMGVGGGTYNQANGQWVDGSSREYKENIKTLSADAALETIEKLTPVTFKMKIAEEGDQQVGFIAEDVPEIVAQKNRKGLAAMDIVAVLTKVVKEQQKTISRLEKRMAEMERKSKK